MAKAHEIEVVPYDPDWPLEFEKEAQRLKNIFKSNLDEIYHIGSTAVPGLAAKPVIDMIPVVKDLTLVDGGNPLMEALGYTPLGEFGTPGRRFFIKGTQKRTHHVHVFQTGDPHVERHLRFRDYLRAHPETAEEYGRFKQALAEKFRHDRRGYTDAKTDFVKKIEKLAEI